MAHSLAVVPARTVPLEEISTVSVDDPDFREALKASYHGTLDFPEMNGLRSIDEILSGHRDQPTERWLGRVRGVPVGVLILSTQSSTLEVAYLGVDDRRRGRGIGRELAIHAVREAVRRGCDLLTLGVDERNIPARRMYESLGFETIDSRDVYFGR